MDKDYILSAIQEYADECLKEPRGHLKKDRFERRSYQKWAVKEILRSIREYDSDKPVMIVEDFIHRMDCFTRRSRNAGAIFSSAKDIATDILEVLEAMG